MGITLSTACNMRSTPCHESTDCKQGLVVHNGTKPTPTSAFDHTSILATVKKLWGLPNFLTKRDAWASTFENIFTLDAPRTDCPTELPRPADPLPYEMIEASRRPINELQVCVCV